MPTKKEGESDSSRNASVCPHSIAPDQHRKQFHLSLDINQPAQVELQNQYNFFLEHEVDVEVKSIFC
jgi:hypothetical protein